MNRISILDLIYFKLNKSQEILSFSLFNRLQKYPSWPMDQILLLHCLFSSVLEIDLTTTFNYLNFLLTKEYQLP